jgi:hypothetical protein
VKRCYSGAKVILNVGRPNRIVVQSKGNKVVKPPIIADNIKEVLKWKEWDIVPDAGWRRLMKTS